MKRKVIIIDDNKMLADSLFTGIDWESLQAKVTHVLYDALPVEDILANEKADLIISDIRMPGLSGLEMAKNILPLYPDIKIILISAYEDFQYVQEAIRLGAFDYIEKPINFDYITRIIEKAFLQLEEDRFIQKQLEESKPAMKEQFFQNVLRLTPYEARYQYGDYPSFLALKTESNHHICILLKIAEAGKWKATLGLHRYLTDFLNLQNMIRQICSTFTLSYLFQNGNSIVLILGRTVSTQPQFMELIQEVLEEIFKDTLKFRLIAGIGSPVRSFWELRESFENARLALEYRFFLPEEQIFYYADLPQKTFLPDTDLDSKYDNIIKLICKNQETELRSYLDTLYQNYLELHVNKMRLLSSISDIAGKILSFLYKMGVPPDSVDQQVIKSFGELERFATSRELFDWLYRLCIMACRQLNSSVSHYQNRMVSMVESYINEHFSETELSLNEIASHVNVSPTHLSATYKKITGKNISDMIAHTRIRYAADLLSHSILSIRDISEKSGFSNQYYFSSCFKKITGKSPSQYRNPQENITE